MSAQNIQDSIRAHALQRLTSAVARTPVRVAFRPSQETGALRYFAAGLADELVAASSAQVTFCPLSTPANQLDVLITTAHGADVAGGLLDLRNTLAPHTLLAVWFWDNHLAQVNNLRGAQAADVSFASHMYCAADLLTPATPFGGWVPACSAQWTTAELTAGYAAAPATRSNQLLMNYVDYAFSPRSAVLNLLAQHMPEADVLRLPPEDRSRYFGQDSAARLRSWLQHKTTLILPVDQDLSTRLFDALAAGLVPIVPHSVVDLDRLIPPALQAELGMVRVAALDLASIRAAHARAVALFDTLGPAGALRRHQFVLNGHLTQHRVLNMTNILLGLNDASTGLVWTRHPVPAGLTLPRRAPPAR